MAVKTLYLLNSAAVTPNWFGSMQDGGSAPAAAAATFGFGVAKVAAGYWKGRIGATNTSGTSQVSSWLGGGPVKGSGATNTTAADCFMLPAPYSGKFAAGNWAFNFGVRTGAASTHAGRMRCQIWASKNADGSSARDLTNGTPQAGSVVTLAALSTTYNSTITWAAPAISLDNEYLFFQVEWQGTVAGGSNSASVLFYQSAGTVTTTDFAAAAVGSGTLPNPDGCVVVGSGISRSFGAGDVGADDAADIVGVGEVVTPGISGDAALAVDAATLAGIGDAHDIIRTTGTGALQAVGALPMWTPKELGADLVGWLDAADAASITVTGSGVSQWTDKSGSGRHGTQANDAFRPPYANGKITLGPVQGLDIVNPLTGYDYIFAGRAAATGTKRVPLLCTTDFVNTYTNLTVQPDDTLGTDSTVYFGQAGTQTWPGNTEGIVYGAIVPYPDSHLAKDGAALQTTTYAIWNPMPTQIGCTATDWHFGDVYEIVMLPSARSNDTKQKLEGYIAWKWNLAARLPGDHPYKSEPPPPTLTDPITLVGRGPGGQWAGPGILAANVAILAATGTVITPPAFGTGVLNSVTSAVASSGVSISFGTSVLTPTNTAMVAQGLSRSFGTSVLTDSVAGLTSVGLSRAVGAGAAVPLSAALQATGLSSSAGVSTLAAVSATLAASGGNFAVGTGALAPNLSTLAGIGRSIGTGSGTLIAPSPSVAVGSGASLSTGSGAPSNQTASLTGAGISRSYGTGAVAANPGGLTASGTAITISAAFGNLNVQSSIVAASGQTASTGTGALSSIGSVLAGSGSARWIATGALSDTGASVASIGSASFLATGVLADTAATVTGSAVVRWIASGALVPGAATLAGVGAIRWVASGSPAASSSAVAAVGLSGSNATLTSLIASLAHVGGYEGVAVITGAGDPVAQSSRSNGLGLSKSAGFGTLNCVAASLSGVGSARSIGTGVLTVTNGALVCYAAGSSSGLSVLQDQAGKVSATGVGSAKGSGALLATPTNLLGSGRGISAGTGVALTGAAVMAGAGLSGSVGSVALAASVSAVTGVQVLVPVTGTGQLHPQSAAVAGLGLSRATGTGILAPAKASVTGTGTAARLGQGALTAATSRLASVARSTSLGTGALRQDDHALAGAGIVRWRGTGVLTDSRAVIEGQSVTGSKGSATLVARSSTLDGFNVVREGPGILVSGSASLSGLGEIIYPVRIPDQLPSSYPGTVPWMGAKVMPPYVGARPWVNPGVRGWR